MVGPHDGETERRRHTTQSASPKSGYKRRRDARSSTLVTQAQRRRLPRETVTETARNVGRNSSYNTLRLMRAVRPISASDVVRRPAGACGYARASLTDLAGPPCWVVRDEQPAGAPNRDSPGRRDSRQRTPQRRSSKQTPCGVHRYAVVHLSRAVT